MSNEIMTDNEKLDMVLTAAMYATEHYVNGSDLRFEDLADPSTRKSLTQVLIAVSFASLVNDIGFFKALLCLIGVIRTQRLIVPLWKEF